MLIDPRSRYVLGISISPEYKRSLLTRGRSLAVELSLGQVLGVLIFLLFCCVFSISDQGIYDNLCIKKSTRKALSSISIYPRFNHQYYTTGEFH